MRKWMLAVVLVVASVGVFAQAQTGYFSILPGYQFSSSEVDSGWVMSLDGGYYFTDFVGIHGGLIFNEGNFSVNVPPYGEAKFDDSFTLIEVGPEFVGQVGGKGQIYGQINLGYAFGLSVDTFEIAGVTYAMTGMDVGNSFAYGAAFGYRHFFNDQVALNLQATYHRIAGDWDTNHFDTRIGVAWKF